MAPTSASALSSDDCSTAFGGLVKARARTLIAAQPHICSRYGQRFRRRNACFEVFGFDVLLDRDLTPYLIEVNVSADLASTEP